MKKVIFWSATLLLLLAAVYMPAFLGLSGNSFEGVTIYIFLGYCAIIVVAQLFACLTGLRSVLEQWTEKRNASRRISLR